MYHPDNIDTSNPLNPEGSFFHYLGPCGLAQPYYTGLPTATLEQFYQAIKARLVYELVQSGHLNPDILLDFTGDMPVYGVDDEDDEPRENESAEEAEKRTRGRPRLTDAEKQERAAQRAKQRELKAAGVSVEPVGAKAETDSAERAAGIGPVVTADTALPALSDGRPPIVVGSAVIDPLPVCPF
jgi:hypothetical protein